MQIVGYRPAVEDPARLLLAADGRVRSRPLAPGTELAYTLGGRHCVGVVDGEDHEPCDRERAPRCEFHVDRWPCARCTGNCDLPIENCRRDHAVYLAAFAPDTFKVGVTKPGRLRRRLREQGADRAVHLRTVTDGRVARRIEAEIAETVGDRVRVSEKVAGIYLTVDEDAWERLLAEFEPIERYAFDYGLDLAERPVAETTAVGTVRGTKGKVIVLEVGATTYATNARDLVGHEVTEGRPDRDRQSSLGAFG